MISRFQRICLALLVSVLGADAFQRQPAPCFSVRQSAIHSFPISTASKSLHRYHKSRLPGFCLSCHPDSDRHENEEIKEQPTSTKKNRIEERISAFTLWTPLWTILACGVAVWKAPLCSKTFGSLPVLQSSYWTLMMTMGLAISQNDIENLQQTSPRILLWNALLCFVGMPLMAVGLSNIGQLPSYHATGLIVLGCVGGGQASNLFCLLAGGNVALSVLCTISTTIVGVLATPLLLDKLLGAAVGSSTSLGATLQSVLSLVFFPLLVGSTLSKSFPQSIQNISKFLPLLGILATLLLVVGGSSNSFLATTISATSVGSWSTILWPSCALGILGGLVALGVAQLLTLDQSTKKTLVVETLSKSPTLAYLLARKHFGIQSALIPGGAMVTLAVLGALVASVWSKVDGNKI